MKPVLKTIASLSIAGLCACSSESANSTDIKEKCMNKDTCVIELNNGVKMPAFGFFGGTVSQKAK